MVRLSSSFLLLNLFERSHRRRRLELPYFDHVHILLRFLKIPLVYFLRTERRLGFDIFDGSLLGFLVLRLFIRLEVVVSIIVNFLVRGDLSLLFD